MGPDQFRRAVAELRRNVDGHQQRRRHRLRLRRSHGRRIHHQRQRQFSLTGSMGAMIRPDFACLSVFCLSVFLSLFQKLTRQ